MATPAHLIQLHNYQSQENIRSSYPCTEDSRDENPEKKKMLPMFDKENEENVNVSSCDPEVSSAPTTPADEAVNIDNHLWRKLVINDIVLAIIVIAIVFVAGFLLITVSINLKYFLKNFKTIFDP